MKRIILLLFIITAFLRAEINEWVTDIYFGNGVWNDYRGANTGMEILQNIILDKVYNGNLEEFKKHHYSDRGDAELNKNIIILSFNWTGSSPDERLSFPSKVTDFIETFYQLKDNNQLEGYSLYDILKVWLTQDPTTPLSNLMWDKIDDIVADYSRSIEETNLVEMIENYEKISLKVSHRVLLVAHSQGNLFGNEVYDNLIPWEKNYFKMVSVGTPASSVLDNTTPYTTLKCDTVIHDNIIGGIPGHLPAKTNCTGEEQSGDGHQFTASYLSNHLSLEEIITNISERIDFLNNTDSQWKPKDINCGSEICEDTRIRVTHIHDAKNMDKHMKDTPVYPFDTENGKIYKIGEKHVMASCGGETVVDNPEDGICYKIEETGEIINGKDTNSSTKPFTIHQGVVETTLGWNYDLDIDMDLEMTGPNVHKDVEDIPDVGLEHAYVESAYDLKPGDLLELYATGEKKADSELEESCLDTEPVKIYAIVKTPAGSKFKQYEAQNFAELNLGKYAEIEVAQKITPKWVCPALSNTPNWHNLYNQVTNNFQCIYCPSPYDVVWSNTAKSYYCNVPQY